MSEIVDSGGNSSFYRSLILGILWTGLAILITVTQIVSTPKIEIKWNTASEYDTAGFNIYRSTVKDQGFERINDELIHSTADTTSGAEYSYIDYNVARGETYYYRLEDVEFDNTSTLHEVVSGQADAVDNWILILTGVCLAIGAGFLLHALKTKLTE